MTDGTNETPAAAPAATPEQAARTQAAAVDEQAIRIYAHSPIIYWWPVWFFGLIFCGLTFSGFYTSDQDQNVLGLSYTAILLFVIFSTTVRLRGANSVIFGLVLAIVAILLITANLVGAVGSFLGQLDINMSATFHLVMSLAVFAQWALMFFLFDRVRYWDIVPGQIHEKVFWGSGQLSENGASAKCHYRSDDFLRHRILGLMILGDLEITLADGRKIEIHNVLFAKRKSRQINEYIVMRPIS